MEAFNISYENIISHNKDFEVDALLQPHTGCTFFSSVTCCNRLNLFQTSRQENRTRFPIQKSRPKNKAKSLYEQQIK